jgi:hypothetical protein
MDDVAKYNDRIFYGFLVFFTAVIGAMAYLINQC